MLALLSRLLTFIGVLVPAATIATVSTAGCLSALSLGLFYVFHRHHTNAYLKINMFLGSVRVALYFALIVCLELQPDSRFVWGAVLGTADTAVAGFNFYAAAKTRTLVSVRS